MEDTKKEVTLNGNKMTLDQFEEKKKEIAYQKDMKLVEIKPNIYKTRIQG